MTQVHSLLAKNDLEIRAAFILNRMSKWYAVNGLFLNIDKTNLIKLIATISNIIHFNLSNKEIKEMTNKISWFQK
jgi:hypothetical protein